VNIGSSSTARFTATNIGPTAIRHVTAAIRSGGGYSITSDGCAGTTVAGASCTFVVTFAPTQFGYSSDWLRLMVSSVAYGQVLLTGSG
jgi:hypothetical protein